MYVQYMIFASIVTSIGTARIVMKEESNKESNAIPISGLSATTTTSATTSATTSITTTTSTMSSNKERNWLLTKAWLIDNINRLRHEFIELERDYNHHIESSDAMEVAKDKRMVQEMATLRADHTVLAQQQKQIIQLIKQRSHTTGPYVPRSEFIETSTVMPKKSHKKRDSHLKHLIKKEQSFEDQTKRNMSEVFAEMTALHDITVNIFEDLMDIQKKVSQSSS